MQHGLDISPLDQPLHDDGQIERVAALRHAIWAGLAFYNAYDLANLVLLPDVFVLGTVLRVLAITPACVILALILGRLSESRREMLVCAAMLSAIAVPIAMVAVSHAPLALYGIAEILLTLVYGGLVLRLTMAGTIGLCASVLVSVSLVLLLRPGLSPELIAAFGLQAATAAGFTLYGCRQLERERRLHVLRGMRLRQRARGLLAERQVFARLSHTDPLTGLANRRLCDSRLAEWAAAPAEDATALLLIDVDHFKRYNDHYGHVAGDAALCEIAGAMRTSLRSAADLLARHGGEEFLVVLSACDMTEARQVAERLRLAVRALGLPHLARDDGKDMVTVSVGGAVVPAGRPMLPASTVRAADAALYEAKRRGRDGSVIQ